MDQTNSRKRTHPYYDTESDDEDTKAQVASLSAQSPAYNIDFTPEGLVRARQAIAHRRDYINRHLSAARKASRESRNEREQLARLNDDLAMYQLRHDCLAPDEYVPKALNKWPPPPVPTPPYWPKTPVSTRSWRHDALWEKACSLGNTLEEINDIYSDLRAQNRNLAVK